MADWKEEVMIFESAFMDAVLGGRGNVFLVHLKADDEVRNKRWTTRKEEGGGRTRQLGESVAARDEEDTQLRRKLYGSRDASAKPVLDLDTTNRTAVEVALQIWEAYEAESGIQVITDKPAMDKGSARGIFPGPATGTVTRYNPKRTPFGGYIKDDRSGREIYVHRSAVTEGDLEAGRKVDFEIVADSFGGFKATKVRSA